ncbi:MAG: TIGR00725 family protein [Planctomycetes bacterium]|nr:TIGR00725 family protein [Planctomycetota bacterium]MCB9905272.1 TIGR00725 family protein [Planctomycetota bacterium]
MPRPLQLAVIGAADCDEDAFDAAREVGRLLAEAGCTILTGGLSGVMEAASLGASEAGGTVVDILPGADRDAANDWVQTVIATGCGDARNAMLVNSADGVIAIGGSWGTLSELAFALERELPVIGLGSFEEQLPIERASTPLYAVAWMLDRLGAALTD